MIQISFPHYLISTFLYQIAKHNSPVINLTEPNQEVYFHVMIDSNQCDHLASPFYF